MSEKFNINNYNNVKVEKLGGNNPISRPENQNNLLSEENVKNVQFTRIPVVDVSDGSSSKSGFSGNAFGNSSGNSSGSDTSNSEEYTDDDEYTDNEDADNEYTDNDDEDDEDSSTVTDLSVDVPKTKNDVLEGGKGRSSDTESVSSVSTTEILSKDPLFLVLSQFLMDDETGSNIVHVGNDIVKVLSKINSKLGRIADSLEKKHKKDKSKNRHKE
jgi:hypothetical protein